MSEYRGYDFNSDGNVSWEESHLTYHIERDTAQKNSDNFNRTTTPLYSGTYKKNTIFSGFPIKGFLVLLIIFIIAAVVGHY